MKKYDWRAAILNEKSTIKDAIKCLINSSLQIVLVVSSKSKLIGTVTDGDIRRGILSNLKLTESILDVIKKNPLVVTSEIDSKTVKYMMSANSLLQLPIVDKKRRIVGLHLWNDYFNTEIKNNIVVIIAGGFGKRMLPKTKLIPKPMLKINNKPILEHIISNIRSCGFKNIIITTHYLGKIIEDHFKDGTKYGVNISYHREKKPLGTAGSLRSINIDKNNPIIVTNGDVITEVNYSEILDYHKTQHADATMAVRTVDQKNPYGVVEAEGVKFKNIIEKPITKISVNAGIYVLNNKAIQLTPKNSKYDMTDLFSKLRKKNKNTVIFPIHENLKEYGSRNDINKKKKWKKT